VALLIARSAGPLRARDWCRAAILAAVVLASLPALADHKEYAVKAAFLVNFARLVEWPRGAFDGPGAPVDLAVLANDHVYEGFKQIIDGKRAGSRKIRVRRIAGAGEATGSHVVFVGASVGTEVGDLLRSAGDGAVLFVGEREDFARDGGTINFYIEDDKIRFEINPGTASRSGIKFSSKLMGLAKIVESAGP
jgi:hypothetical protein